MLRTYTSAFVYSFPDLELVGELRLPAQQQGEGLAVVGEDRLYLSSEGVNSPVLTMTLPTDVVRAMAPASATARRSRRPSPRRTAVRGARARRTTRSGPRGRGWSVSA